MAARAGTAVAIGGPVPVGKGMPGEGYPWHWTVSPWLPGEVAALAPVADLSQTAMSLAQFVRALQAIDPAARSVSFVAGLLLPAIRSAELQLRHCEIVSMSGLYWRYGTLLSRNRCGRGWTYLSADARQVFSDALAVDDPTWARGRGWALHLGLMAAAVSVDNPVLGNIGRYAIAEVLSDYAQG